MASRQSRIGDCLEGSTTTNGEVKMWNASNPLAAKLSEETARAFYALTIEQGIPPSDYIRGLVHGHIHGITDIKVAMMAEWELRLADRVRRHGEGGRQKKTKSLKRVA